jgi:hypothetical protein
MSLLYQQVEPEIKEGGEMKLTTQEIMETAADFISYSQDLEAGETINREELAIQMSFTDCEMDDIEAIAVAIENKLDDRRRHQETAS